MAEPLVAHCSAGCGELRLVRLPVSNMLVASVQRIGTFGSCPCGDGEFVIENEGGGPVFFDENGRLERLQADATVLIQSARELGVSAKDLIDYFEKHRERFLEGEVAPISHDTITTSAANDEKLRRGISLLLLKQGWDSMPRRGREAALTVLLGVLGSAVYDVGKGATGWALSKMIPDEQDRSEVVVYPGVVEDPEPNVERLSPVRTRPPVVPPVIRQTRERVRPAQRPRAARVQIMAPEEVRDIVVANGGPKAVGERIGYSGLTIADAARRGVDDPELASRLRGLADD